MGMLQVAKTLCFDVRNAGVDLTLNKVTGVLSAAIRRWVQHEEEADASTPGGTKKILSKEIPADNQAPHKARDDPGNQGAGGAGSEAAGSAVAAFETVVSHLNGAPY